MNLLIRISTLALSLLVVFVVSRGIIRSLPGDPIENMIAETGTKISAEILRTELGLDQPFFLSLKNDFLQLLKGDFGRSLLDRETIGGRLKTHFSKTLQLAFFALILGLGFSLALGLSACYGANPKFRQIADRTCSFWGGLMAALPTPWIGPVLMYLLGIAIPIFPISNSIFLPAITLSLGFSGVWARLIRNRVNDEIKRGPALAARARGIGEWKILFKYGLAPASGSLVGYLGTQIGFLLSGAFVTEIIFNWDGMGVLFVEAVLSRDYPVVEAAAFIGAATTLLGSALGDFAQSLIDKRTVAR